MSDVALRNAEAARKRLRDEIQRLSAALDAKRLELATAETFIKQYAKYADQIGTVVDEQTGEDVPWKNPSRASVGRQARTVILNAGRPLKRDELFSKLESQGVELRGTDPKMILSTMLWRMKDKFVRLKGFGYWPADQSYEPAHYIVTPLPWDIRNEAANADVDRRTQDKTVT